MAVKKYKVQSLGASGVPTLIDLETGLPEIWSRIRQLFYDKDEVTVELSSKQDKLTEGNNISISNDNKISTSGVYTSTETDTAISEAIDGLKSEVESELSDIQSSLDSVASDIPSVEAGDNISVTHTGTVYTVSTSGVYTSSEVDTLIGNATSTLESALESAKSETDLAINKVTESLTDYLPLTGGTMSGNIVIGSSGTTIRSSDGHIVLSSGIELY